MKNVQALVYNIKMSESVLNQETELTSSGLLFPDKEPHITNVARLKYLPLRNDISR